MKAKISLSFILFSTLLVGCASSSNIDVKTDSLIYNLSINTVVVENNTGSDFDGTNVVALMETAVKTEITKSGLLLSSEERVEHSLEVNIIQYTKGNAVARWLVPGAGKTILSVEARLVSETGTTVAESQATESIGAGGLYTVGAWKRVFDKVAKSLIKDIKSIAS